MLNEGNQIHNFISSSGSGTAINYRYGSGSDFLTSYGSGSTSQKVTVHTVRVRVPVPQRCLEVAETHAPLEDVVLDGVRLDAVLAAVPQDPNQVVDEDSRGARSREDLLRASDLQGGIMKHLLKKTGKDKIKCFYCVFLTLFRNRIGLNASSDPRLQQRISKRIQIPA
jgi:hypothetical protein